MLFHELYGSYYQSVALILTRAAEGTLNARSLTALVQENAFGESLLRIPAALRGGDWPLMTADYRTPLKTAPTMPLTLLQRRWLKTLLLDPRVRLFDPPQDGLEDISPLFTPDIFDYYDQYRDGDPFEEEGYISRFRIILSALRQETQLRLTYVSQRGHRMCADVTPLKLEYSLKDDKFRLVCSSSRGTSALNLARIEDAQKLDLPASKDDAPPTAAKSLVAELIDERNALERAMMHFSDLRKETERIDENRYRMTLWYDAADEAEIRIRILSFGPRIRVISPDTFIAGLRERLSFQCTLNARQTTQTPERSTSHEDGAADRP